MDWATVKDAIVSAVKLATGIEDVIWSGQPAGWRGSDSVPGVWVDLLLRTNVAIGQDEYQQKLVNGVFTQTLVGNRRLVVEARIQTLDQTSGTTATGHYSGFLRSRLYFPAVKDLLLQPVNVAISRVLETRDFQLIELDRQVSISLTDIVFLVGEIDIDTLSTNDYIEVVELDGMGFNELVGTQTTGTRITSFGDRRVTSSGDVRVTG
jgi:hypothetical protein